MYNMSFKVIWIFVLVLGLIIVEKIYWYCWFFIFIIGEGKYKNELGIL